MVSPYVRHMFFSLFKSQKVFKEAEKAVGKIKSITIVITQEKTFMRSVSETEIHDTPMTDDEKKKMLKMFHVKEESIQDCKTVFVMGNFETKKIHIQQNKLNGEKKELEI